MDTTTHQHMLISLFIPKNKWCLRAVLIKPFQSTFFGIFPNIRTFGNSKTSANPNEPNIFLKNTDHLSITLRVDPLYFRRFRFLIHVDSWYFRKINPLNLWYSQETINPLKIPIPTLASDRGIHTPKRCNHN